MTPLRWGLLGTARINRALIPPIRASARHTLVAVASRSPEQGSAYAAEWNIPRVHAGYEALLADPEIDVVYLPLPNHLHAPWAIKAMRAGKHVLCEKPLALTVEDVDRLAETAQSTGRVVAEAFMYRHHARTLKVKELIDQGAIGEVRFVRGAFSFTLDRPNNIRFHPEMGGGSLWDVGCYPVSFARFVLGAEPVEVFGQQVLGPTGVDLSFAGQLCFPNGVLCQFDSSFQAPFRMEMTIVGSEGILDVPRAFKPDAESHVILRAGDTAETITVEGNPLYLDEVEDMGNAILLGTPPRIPLSDSRANVATLVALLQSARDGCPVTVEAGPRQEKGLSGKNA